MSDDVQPVEKKPRILLYCDFLKPTGFGNVAKNIVKRIMDNYDFEILAINYDGMPYSRGEYSVFKDLLIFPAAGLTKQRTFDPLGLQRFVNLLYGTQFDILFIIQDTFNVARFSEYIREAKKAKKFSFVYYFPVDGELKSEWVEESVKLADFPIAYTEYGKKEIEKHTKMYNMGVIPHGIDLEVFKPMTETERKNFRKEYYGVESDQTYLIVNVNRNQTRKDLGRSLLAYNHFVEEHPEITSRYYLHTLRSPTEEQGYNLEAIARDYCSKKTQNQLIYPNQEEYKVGIPEVALAAIYGSADVVISTSLGEGWGLSSTESMACGTPVIMPRHTSMPEIIGENEERGYLVSAGKTVNDWAFPSFDNSLRRPLTDLQELADKLAHVQQNPDEAKAKAKVALDWVQELDWNKVVEKYWKPLLKDAENP